jgi:hypothetical protein
MMDSLMELAVRDYAVYWALLMWARGMDFLSTWVATPNLALEGNPIARFLGWKWGALVNVVVCSVAAFWPLMAIMLATTSVLVAARNLQSAWLMRMLGEDRYRDWLSLHFAQVPIGLYLFCLLTQSVLVAAVGGALMAFSQYLLVPFGVGMGMVTYAVAVTFYMLLAMWRVRRSSG